MEAVRRLRSAALLAAGVLACAGASVSAASPVPVAPVTKTRLRGFACIRAYDPGSRALDITAVMRPVPGTWRMAMRFLLMRRAIGGGQSALQPGGDLGVWLTPSDRTLGRQPGDRWIVHHPVANLSGPAAYRFVVEFRWTGRGGREIAAARRVSRRCVEPEQRPDLTVVGVKIVPLANGLDRYVADVRNLGESPAGPFDVALSIGSAPTSTALPDRHVTGLAAGAGVHVAVRGPACTSGQSLTAVADSGQVVDDANRINNTYVTTCP